MYVFPRSYARLWDSRAMLLVLPEDGHQNGVLGVRRAILPVVQTRQVSIEYMRCTSPRITTPYPRLVKCNANSRCIFTQSHEDMAITYQLGNGVSRIIRAYSDVYFGAGNCSSDAHWHCAAEVQELSTQLDGRPGEQPTGGCLAEWKARTKEKMKVCSAASVTFSPLSCHAYSVSNCALVCRGL